MPPARPDLREVDFTHPDVVAMVADVQQEYVIRYGGPDEGPLESDDFAAPTGGFYAVYDDGVPMAMGGWRLAPDAPVAGVAAEIKRMYVAPTSRRRGLARVLLARLEAAASAAGADWLVLETGDRQPEAIQLYTSCGYEPVPAFGHYRDSPTSVHLGKRLVRG